MVNYRVGVIQTHRSSSEDGERASERRLTLGEVNSIYFTHKLMTTRNNTTSTTTSSDEHCLLLTPLQKLEKIELDLLLRTYDTQRDIKNQLEKISKILTEYAVPVEDPQERHSLYVVYDKWRLFYIKYYWTELFERKKSNDPDQNLDRFFSDIKLSQLYKSLPKTSGSLFGTSDDGSSSTHVRGVILDEGEEVEDVNVTEVYDPDRKYPLLSLETPFFEKFYENRPSVLLFQELFKIWLIVHDIGPHAMDQEERDHRFRQLDFYESSIEEVYHVKLTKFIYDTFPNEHFECVPGASATSPEFIDGTPDFVIPSEERLRQTAALGISSAVTIFQKWHAFLEDIGKDLIALGNHRPPFFILFGLSHLYFYMEHMRSVLAPYLVDEPLAYLGRFTIPSRLHGLGMVTPMISSETSRKAMEYDFLEILIYFANHQFTYTSTISVEIEDFLSMDTAFPGLRDYYISKEVSQDRKERYRNRPQVRCTLDETYLKALQNFHPELYKEIRGEGMMEIQAKWSHILKKDPRYHMSFYLCSFHYFFQENIQFSYWRQRYVIPIEGWTRYSKEICKYSKKVPLFVQMSTYCWYLVWDNRYLCSSKEPTLMFYTYLKLVQKHLKCILPGETDIMRNCPWTLLAKRDIPKSFPTMDDVWKNDVHLDILIEKLIPEKWKMICEEKENALLQLMNQTNNGGKDVEDLVDEQESEAWLQQKLKF